MRSSWRRRHTLPGDATGCAQGEAAEARRVERHDAFAGAEARYDLGEVPRQLPWPAEGVDAVGEGSGEQLREILDHFDAKVFRERKFGRHG